MRMFTAPPNRLINQFSKTTDCQMRKIEKAIFCHDRLVFSRVISFLFRKEQGRAQGKVTAVPYQPASFVRMARSQLCVPRSPTTGSPDRAGRGLTIKIGESTKPNKFVRND